MINCNFTDICKNNRMEIQKIFFETTKQRLNPNLRLVDVISDLLNIGSDSAYRRLRGEKELTLSELVKLSAYFNISIDSLLNYKSDNVIFKYTPLDFTDMQDYTSYIRSLSNLYEGLAKAKRKEILITAQDIPIFHFTPFVELTFFKLYAWNQSINRNQISYDQFVSGLDRDELSLIYDKIINSYSQIPSTEIWSENTIEPILRLFDYHLDMDCFESKQYPVLLCHQLLQLIENVELWAEKGCKEHNGDVAYFQMYLSSVDMENNFVITKRDDVTTTSVKLFTINGIFTSNDAFCEETERWIRSLISKSLYLSGSSDRERFRFFQQIKNKINDLLEKFERKKK